MRTVALPEEAGGGSTEVWVDVPARRTAAEDLLLLAHGAGGHAEHPTILALAAAFRAQSFTVARFDFPYRRRADDGTRRRGGPDRMPKLVACTRAVLTDLVGSRAPARVFLAGHSMGGRAAAALASEAGVACAGVVLCAFPLHPPGRPERDRSDALVALRDAGIPALWASGTRDPFCTGQVAEPLLERLAPDVRFVPLEGATHAYEVPKRSGRTRDDVLDDLARATRTWADERMRPRRRKA